MTELVRTCCNRLECELILKLHRGSLDSVEEVTRLVEATTRNTGLVTVQLEGDSAELVKRCSTCVTSSSTTAYHALVHGATVVLLRCLTTQAAFYAERYDAALVVEKIDDLSDTLAAAVGDESVRGRLYAGGESLIRDHLFALDGKASARIAQFVGRLARRH